MEIAVILLALCLVFATGALLFTVVLLPGRIEQARAGRKDTVGELAEEGDGGEDDQALDPKLIAAMVREALAEKREKAGSRADAETRAARSVSAAELAHAREVALAIVNPIVEELRKIIVEFATFVRSEIERAEQRSVMSAPRRPISTGPTDAEVEADAKAQRATVELGKEEVDQILKKAANERDDPPSTTRKPDRAPASRERPTPSRRAPGVAPPGSAPLMPPEPGITAAGLDRPKSVRPVAPLPPPVRLGPLKTRTTTFLGGMAAPTPPTDDRPSDEEITKVADKPALEALGLAPARADGNEPTLLSMPAVVPSDRKTDVEIVPGAEGT